MNKNYNKLNSMHGGGYYNRPEIKIGIIVADKKSEYVEGLIKLYKEQNIPGVKIDIRMCGVGIVNATMATYSLITGGCDIIMNYGSAGKIQDFNDDYIYKVFKPKMACYHDVYTPWYKRGVTPGEKQFYHAQNGDNTILASGSSFIDNFAYAIELKNDLGATIVDMEGAAIAQVCDTLGKPVYFYKGISDIIQLGDYEGKEKPINTRIYEASHLAFNEMVKTIFDIVDNY